MHWLVLLFLLVFVNVKFLSKKAVPVSLEFGFSGFSNDFTFYLNRVLIFLVVEGFKSRTTDLIKELSGRRHHLLGGCIWIGWKLHCWALRHGIWKSYRVSCANLILTRFYHRVQFFSPLLLINLRQFIRLEISDWYFFCAFDRLVIRGRTIACSYCWLWLSISCKLQQNFLRIWIEIYRLRAAVHSD